MENKDCLYGVVIRRGKEIVTVAVLCFFMALLCLLFIAVGIVWSLADCTIRKLEKGAAYEEKT